MSVDDFDGDGVSSDGGFEVVDRRRLVMSGLAAVAGAAVVASVAEPASAANGGPVVLGAANTASATTKVSTTVGNGLQGSSSATGGYGVLGSATNGNGVYGTSSAAGYTAVLGKNTNATTGGNGVRGIAVKGTGVRGETSDALGAGVHGVDLSGGGGVGVRADTTNGYGVYSTATSIGGYGVYGAGLGTGIYGYASGTGGTGVNAVADGTGGWGIYADGAAYAGYFNGNVYVSGTLAKAGGSFRIDHPVDPANKFLSHSFVESPDMMNIYNGIAVLDDDGKATVEMPDWFDALNRDFRYQLTPFGAAPNLNISSEMKDGKFTIAGGSKGQKVSWQVTGIRQDAWANAHRIPVEEDKTEKERGKYLHPDVVKGVRNAKSLHPAPKAPPKSTAPLAVPVR